jgi:hypothetical protein
MKERPILFSGAMVQAILRGDKTQTRRVCKSQPYPNGFKFDGREILCHTDYLPPSTMLMGVKRGGLEYTTSDAEGWESECPYGQEGGRLWVRETWKPGSWRDDGRVAIDYAASPELTHTPWLRPTNFETLRVWWENELMHAGSIPDAHGVHHWEPGKSPMHWRPSIHMPRWACRIVLEITDVRVERLNDISHEDAIAEGCGGQGWKVSDDRAPVIYPCNQFAELWDSINAKRAPWASNPYVWALTFRRAE